MGKHGLLAGAARTATLVLAIILVTSIATGWLYWVRAGVAHWPGPVVHDALPLDELPGHDRVPLVVFVAAFGVAGIALGLVARALRLDRLAAGLGLAAGTGVWLFFIDAVCLLIVRQESFGQGFGDAAGLQPVYLAAALTGAGGALLARSIQVDQITRRVLSWLVAGGGLIGIVSAVIPRPGAALGLVERLGPGTELVARALLVPSGILLLIVSRGLARGNRRAWRLAVALLGPMLDDVIHRRQNNQREHGGDG